MDRSRLAATVALIRRRREAGVASPRRRLPRQQPPTMIQLDYMRALEPLVAQTATLIARELLPTLPHELEQHARADGLIDVTVKLHKLAKEAAGMIEPKRLWWLAEQTANATSDFQRAQLGMATRAALGVDLSLLEPTVTSRIGGWVAENVSLIRSVPETYLSRVEDRVLEAVRGGERWESLARSLTEEQGIAERRAQLIARDQVGKLYGDLNQARQEALGVTSYTWRTSQDGRVRDEHEEREGQVFQWDDPPEDGAPGEPINCRCYAEPDFSDIVEGLSEPT